MVPKKMNKISGEVCLGKNATNDCQQYVTKDAGAIGGLNVLNYQ